MRRDCQQVMLHVAHGEEDMLKAHDSFHPDAIVAPFLTKRVPERLWRNNATCPVLIVHPGVRGDRGVSSIDWALKSAFDFCRRCRQMLLLLLLLFC